MKTAIQTIPDILIYEMVDNQPIYYNDYLAYLSKTKKIEEIMGSSVLQSLVISRLVFWLQSYLGFEYDVLTNELGIQFEKKNWRAADIAVVRSEKIQSVTDPNKYLNFPPDLIIEIDTKASLKDIKNPLNYYHEKTEDLLQFGVPKVVWIFTETKKVMIAEKGKKWETSNWDESIEIIDGQTTSIEKIINRTA